MSSESSEKTEEPSEHRLRQAREKGQVAKSSDFVACSSMFFVILLLLSCSSLFFRKIIFLFKESLNALDHPGVERGLIAKNLGSAFDTWFFLSLPMLGAAALGAIIANIAQFGFLFSSYPLKFDLKKIDPVAGLKRLFSSQRLADSLKQVVKFLVILLVIFEAQKQALPELLMMFRSELSISLSKIFDLSLSMLLRVMLCFFIIAIVDFFWQRYSFLKSMRMTKYEVKKEYIQQEGDPHIKSERKRIQQEALEAMSMAKVKDASVVITNPSHLAVALKYNEQEDGAPRVISKGVGRRAKHIINEAVGHKVPVMRNVPLARDLQWLDIDEEIPKRLYDSVAEVLTFIAELNAKNEGHMHQ